MAGVNPQSRSLLLIFSDSGALEFNCVPKRIVCIL